ncbi:hypothetical protein BJ138DRAFT_787118 [Hygrophoropsis aurantiaca]|uniref:Uncharacterized protein n=1 Tax=Hygrophoropsis aurantiaca TaxID=72124 RepID=A0ACB7ZXG4_9AGAM|nr:hypothetical protein BJ138DRAFT_787118 [Hygrophoropsis aurantiaca]
MLESNLVQSARLSLNWPPNDNAKPIRSRVINISRRDRYTLALCRWLFTLDRHRVRILCYDLDGADNLTTEERCSILYKCDKGWKLDVMRFEQTLLDERSGDENHPVGFLLATMFDAASPLRKSALYSVILADGMFPTLYFVLDAKGPSTMDIGPRLLAIFTPSGGPQDVLFVDIETYQCCRFPESASSSPQVVTALSQFTILD